MWQPVRSTWLPGPVEVRCSPPGVVEAAEVPAPPQVPAGTVTLMTWPAARGGNADLTLTWRTTTTHRKRCRRHSSSSVCLRQPGQQQAAALAAAICRWLSARGVAEPTLGAVAALLAGEPVGAGCVQCQHLIGGGGARLQVHEH